MRGIRSTAIPPILVSRKTRATVSTRYGLGIASGMNSCCPLTLKSAMIFCPAPRSASTSRLKSGEATPPPDSVMGQLLTWNLGNLDPESMVGVVAIVLPVDVVSVGSDTPEVRKRLDDARALLKAAGLDGAARVVGGQPETALGTLIDEDGYDLLVMGAYGHSRFRESILGGATRNMLELAEIPVLMAH